MNETQGRMNINDQPGHAMDAVIAEKLFSLNNLHPDGMWLWHENEHGEFYKVPEYSTTWEGMRLVVEEMQRRGWDHAIESDGEMRHARFFKRLKGDYSEFNAEQPAPYVVCMAALYALNASGTMEGQRDAT